MGSNLAILLVCLVTLAAGKTWPTDSTARCSADTKQKAMYGSMDWSPSLNAKPFTSFEVITEWNDLEFNPTSNPTKGGGVYISYTTGVTNGPGGYFGVQIIATGGMFLFSFWDKGRWSGTGHKQPKIASQLVWPADMTNCKRNCQDCGLPELRQWLAIGLTTGTKCFVKYNQMKVGDKYKIVMQQRVKQGSLDTRKYGGMPKVHKDRLNEQDKIIAGAIWDVYAYDLQRNNKKIVVGSMIMEGDGAGMDKLSTFDEMLGCRKCNMIHHKDTRYGPVLGADDGSIRRPTAMKGKTRDDSTCKKYSITGSKTEESITFENGPFVKNIFPYNKSFQPVW